MATADAATTTTPSDRAAPLRELVDRFLVHWDALNDRRLPRADRGAMEAACRALGAEILDRCGGKSLSRGDRCVTPVLEDSPLFRGLKVTRLRDLDLEEVVDHERRSRRTNTWPAASASRAGRCSDE